LVEVVLKSQIRFKEASGAKRSPTQWNKTVQKLQKQLSSQKNELNFHIPYESVLNASQLEAVTHKGGPLLVIAGAGSGKTRTLTYRVARLVEEGVSAKSILLLTFTRKAALEMLTRATQLLDKRCEKVSGGTFHSFANAVLRKYASQIGFDSSFTILDRSDTENLLVMIRKDVGPTSKKQAFPKKQTLANIFSRAVNKTLSIEEVIIKDYPHFIPQLDIILDIFEAYKDRKVQYNFIDFDDLLVYLHILLKDHPDIRNHLSASYSYIMVDEYQDTNRIQADILHLLTSLNNNIMVVGDDAQSIYAFRGANFKNIMDFPNSFPGTKIINLEENYRSVQPILDLTNIIIDRAREKYQKALFTQKPGGSKPLLVDVGSERVQSRFVTGKILELHQNGVPFNQIAVLFRASFHSFALEIELGREQIPFIKVGGFKFVESAHVKDVLSHLKVICNPSDRLSWYRMLLLLDKIGPQRAQNIYEAIAKEKSGYIGLLNIDSKSNRYPGIKQLKKLFLTIHGSPLSVSEMGEAVINYYEPILRKRFDDHPKRARDLEQLVTIMQNYSKLEGFLADMALEPPNTSVDDTFSAGKPGDDRLVLSTIHSAKGLEWHTIFIIWALDGRFPSMYALNSADELEEELRLMYVASTRAKENLYFTYPSQTYDRSSGLFLNCPSRFIDAIPDEILAKYTTSIW
jgi:DNA helicase-2/ATP-dependent DNA helicase PcrA